MSDYTKEQLKKVATFLRHISTPVEKTLSNTDSCIALATAKYLESLIEEKNV